MDAGSIERLALKQGEKVTAPKVRQLEAAIARQTKTSGRGIRQKHLPWGTIVSSFGRAGGGGTSSIFAPSARRVKDGFEVSWQKGFIAGLEPKIDESPISQADPETKKVPTFHVAAADFSARGEANIYFRLIFDANWLVTKIEPLAAPETPAAVAWRADKLALILFADGGIWRALHSNQGHLALNRRSSGLAQHLFWGKM